MTERASASASTCSPEEFGEHERGGFVIVGALGVALHLGAGGAFDQHLDRAVGQLEQLQDAGERAHLVDGAGRRIIVRGILLGGEQDEGVRAHHFFQRLDRLLAPDEERNDHVGEDDDIPQRQDRIGAGLAGNEGWLWFCAGHGPKSFCAVPLALRPEDSAS